MHNLLWFGGWLSAILVLFVLALRLPQFCWRYQSSVARSTAVAAALSIVVAVTVLANLALSRHDSHFDFTFERVFTPDAAAMDVIRNLKRPVRLTYFYREDDPEGKRAQHIVELMAHESRWLDVTTVDPDRDPSLAQTAGVKLYNAALLQADGRQVVVHSTNETDIALGIQKVLRERLVTVCFIAGHGQYPSDNYEFHTHIEQLGGGDSGHDHGSATAVVETTGHGVGRFRRSLEALGYEIREIVPAANNLIDPVCRAVIDAGPRTPYSAAETAALTDYLQAGGAALLLYDLELDMTPAHTNLLARLGVRVTDTVVVDPTLHYSSDSEMVAVTSYATHASTRRISFTFFPGARALERVPADDGVVIAELFSTSKNSYHQVIKSKFQQHDGGHAHAQAHDHSETVQAKSHVLALASEGTLSPNSSTPFRVIVVGDSDFTSNSFYPYMSNSRLALAMLRWLVGEEKNVALAAKIPIRKTVELTNDQQRTIFLLLVVVLPLLVSGVGVWVWWQRR